LVINLMHFLNESLFILSFYVPKCPFSRLQNSITEDCDETKRDFLTAQ
jgi:hypothetical protein